MSYRGSVPTPRRGQQPARRRDRRIALSHDTDTREASPFQQLYVAAGYNSLRALSDDADVGYHLLWQMSRGFRSTPQMRAKVCASIGCSDEELLTAIRGDTPPSEEGGS